MAQWAYRSGSFVSAGNGSGNALSINKPTGTASGDLLIFHVYWESDTNTVTASDSLTSALRQANTGSFMIETFYKIAGGSEPTTYTFTPATNGQWRAAVGAAYSSGTGAGPWIDTSGGSQADGVILTSQTAPSITTGGTNRLVTFNYGNYSGTDSSVLAGFATNLRGSFGGVVLGDAAQASAGATGTTRPSTGPGTEDYAATHIAFISDSASSSSPLSASGTSTASFTGASQAGGAISASGTGTGSFTGASQFAAALSTTGVGTGAFTAAGAAGGALSSSGTGTASFASSTFIANVDVSVISRRYGRRKERRGIDLTSKRFVKAKTVLVNRVVGAALSSSGTGSASFASSASVTFDVVAVSRRYARRKPRRGEEKILLARRNKRKGAVLYVPAALSPILLSRRQWRKRKKPDSLKILLAPKHERRENLYFTRFVAGESSLSASGTSTASFGGASLAAGVLSSSGVGSMNATSSVIAAATWVANGAGDAVFASTDALPAPIMNIFGRKRMVKL